MCVAPVFTNDSGVFERVVPSSHMCLKQAVIRIASADNKSTAFYVELELPPLVDGANDPIFAMLYPITVHETVPATVFSIADAFNDTNTYMIEFADGLEMDIQPFTFYGQTVEIYDLRSVRVPGNSSGLEFAEGASDFEGFYGFWPEADVNNANGGPSGYPIRIPNSTNLADGTKVEFYGLGGLNTHLYNGAKLAEGVWEKIGEGTVSGNIITSDPENGLPFLTWFGYRAQ